jgi:hypothetical protein
VSALQHHLATSVAVGAMEAAGEQFGELLGRPPISSDALQLAASEGNF